MKLGMFDEGVGGLSDLVRFSISLISPKPVMPNSWRSSC